MECSAESRSKNKRELRTRETKNSERKKRAVCTEIERSAITAHFKERLARLEELIRDPDPDGDPLDERVRELKREITSLRRALYLLKKTGKSGI